MYKIIHKIIILAFSLQIGMHKANLTRFYRLKLITLILKFSPMKKIFCIVIILFFTNNLIAQNIELPKGFEDSVNIEFEKRKSDWEGSFELFRQIQIEVYQQSKISKVNRVEQDNNSCGDAGFETGILNASDWGGFYQKFTVPNFNCTNNSNNIDAAPWVAGLANVSPTNCEYPNWNTLFTTVVGAGSTIINYCTTPTGCVSLPEVSLSHFFIASAGNDPIIGSLLPQVRPAGGLHSLRLGNAYPNNGTEKITKTFTVTTSNTNFSFWYALVMGQPSNHFANELSTFIIQIKENNIGGGTTLHNNLVNLSGTNNWISSGDPILATTTTYINPCGATTTREPMAYRPWSYFSVNLASLIGKNVTIEIITRDCAPTGHFAYAYLDDFCSAPDSTNPTGSININPETTDTCGFPGNICVNYTVPTDGKNTGTTQLTLNFLQNGIPVVSTSPMVSPVLSTSGTYCFNLTSANTPPGNFDYAITGTFNILSPISPFPNISLTSQFIGTAPDGVTMDQNNDYNIDCPPCSCGTFDSIMLDNTLWWNDPQPVPNLSYASPGTASGILSAFYTCNDPTGQGCPATYSWQVSSNGIPVNPDITSSTNSFNLNLLNVLPCGTYSITLTPSCGNSVCPPKVIRVKIECSPPPVCSCVGTITINQSTVNVVSQNNISNANPVSTATTSFTLTSSVPVSEVRILIDEFRLTTSNGNDNCMLCKNKPQTWANINAGSLSGVNTQRLGNPSTLEIDLRELIFSYGPGTFFNLNGNTLNLTLAIPGVTGLDCCTLKAEVCVKFIIRDVNCCEREVMKCFTFNLQ